MSRPRTKRVNRTIAAAVILASMLTGCSGLYYDRRDTIALSGGDAIAANEVTQMIDPWPAHSGNANIASNGQKMQSAVERYRTNKVIAPVSPTTLETTNQQQAAQPTQIAAPSGNMSSTSTTPSLVA